MSHSSLSIRIRSEADSEAIDALMRMTHSTTAAKALMAAIHRYPAEQERRIEAERTVRRLEERIRQMETGIRNMLKAIDDRDNATAFLARLTRPGA